MYGHRLALAALLVAAGATIAMACGPFFPWQLLDDRNETLKATPSSSFAFEAAHLIAPPKDRLKAVEADWWTSDQDRASTIRKANVQGLTGTQATLVDAMRGSGSGDRAYASGDGLPPAVRLYTAAAVDYRLANAEQAEKRFAAVLALPDAYRRARAVWAAFMLGKLDARENDDEKAAREFEQARTFALAGAPDPLGLAVASYGEEAKLHFDRANALLARTGAPAPSGSTPTPNAPDDTHAGYTLPAENAASYRHELAAAVALYAEQAARGSDNGVQSLRIVAENVLSDQTRIDAAVSEPTVLRDLTIYVLARVLDDSSRDAIRPDAGTREPGVTPNPLLPALVGAIEKAGIAQVDFADRLASLSYRVGRYDLAARFAHMSANPLARWVEAKLAIQRGDLAAAERDYAAASRAFPAAGKPPALDGDATHLLQGESGVVKLARGEYLDALDTLYPVAGTYWGDVAHIAERVLTVDELKSYVDAHVAAVPFNASAAASGLPPAAQLRNLLARRLMREGRYDEALGYFYDPSVRKWASDYADALHESESDWGRVDRGEAMFKAAVLARQWGMEIMGTEAEPDYASWDGAYDTGTGQTELKGPFITGDEKKRFAASKAKPDIRYHYRYIAVDEVNRAADLLPARSQAFAAVLCTATGWMMSTPGADAQLKALYRRYVKQGPHVAWAKHFGRDCPKPDFAGAIYLERVQPYRDLRRFVSRHRWTVLPLTGLAALLLLFAGLYAANVVKLPALDRAMARLTGRGRGRP